VTISAISPFSASQTSNYQNYRQAFSQLANALQSGDLDAAKSAYDTVKSSPAAQGTGPFAQALQQIGNALDSNDLDGAQKALATLQQQQRAHGHHHHHHGGVSGQDSTDSSAPSGDTETVNTDVQVTATFDSTNKVDITT
jgi:hypothetical protein